MNHDHPARPQRGFTIIEVLISLIIIAVGLLGIAKMQALAFSSTGVASMRSLAAIEATSLAASMHADRAYWASGTAAVPPGVTINGTTISDANLAQTANCASAGAPADCNTVLLAAYDVQQWAAALVALLPNPQSTIVCNNVINEPTSCAITITWFDNMVAVNNQGTNAVGMASASYTLYVTP